MESHAEGGRDMKLIPLSRPGVFALVDDDDFERLNAHTWTAQLRETGDFHAARYHGTKWIYMHHEILPYRTGYIIDHRDGNGLNNTRHNLRYATKQQNAWNSRKRAGTLSRFKGVSRSRQTPQRPWRAYIQTPDKRYKHLGLYLTETEAAEAYDRKAQELFGPYARLNFPFPNWKEARKVGEI